MKHSSVFVLALVLSLSCGCGHGLIGTMPVVDDRANASEIVIVRGYQWLGHAVSAYVSFDNNEFLALRAAQYTRFPAPPGNHTISVKSAGAPSTTIPVVLAPKERYYFNVTASAMGFHIEPIGAKEAEPYMAEDEFLPLDNTRK